MINTLITLTYIIGGLVTFDVVCSRFRKYEPVGTSKWEQNLDFACMSVIATICVFGWPIFAFLGLVGLLWKGVLVVHKWVHQAAGISSDRN